MSSSSLLLSSLFSSEHSDLAIVALPLWYLCGQGESQQGGGAGGLINSSVRLLAVRQSSPPRHPSYAAEMGNGVARWAAAPAACRAMGVMKHKYSCLSSLARCWHPIFLLTYGGWAGTCIYWGVHVCLDLSGCLMEARAAWTQAHSQPDEPFTCYSGAATPVCWVVNWTNRMLIKSNVSPHQLCVNVLSESRNTITYWSHAENESVSVGAACLPMDRLIFLCKIHFDSIVNWIFLHPDSSFRPSSLPKPLCVQVACLIRVPTEVVKQRTQASPTSTTYHTLLTTVKEEVQSNHLGLLAHVALAFRPKIKFLLAY